MSIPKNRKKVVFVISSEGFAHNYLGLRNLERLFETFQVMLLVNRKVKLSKFNVPSGIEIMYYQEDEFLNFEYGIAHSLMTWRNRKKSISFSYKFKRDFPSFYWQICSFVIEWKRRRIKDSFLNTSRVERADKSGSWMDSNFRVNVTKSILKFLMREVLKNTIKIMSFDKPFKIVKRIYIDRIPVNSELFASMVTSKPDLVVFPNIGFGATSIEIAKVCRKLKIKTLYLIDNWDNLTSKSILWEKPDFITTWGPQSNMHAQKVQGIKSESIFNIGTPRYKGYLLSIKSQLFDTLPTEEEYILVLGSIHYSNINLPLEIIHNQLERYNADNARGIRIIFRPHPSNSLHSSLRGVRRLKFMELDLESRKRLETSGDAKQGLSTSIDYLPKLISNAKFIVGGASSMVIEAAMMHKSYVILANRERFNLNSPHRMIANFEHLKELERLSNVCVINSLRELEEFVKSNLCKSKSVIDKSALDRERSYFYAESRPCYEAALLDVVSRVV